MNIKMIKRNISGFSLIELMIVVAIIGIIAAIGYPSYTTYLHKAGKSEGKALLLEVMEKQEQHYRNNVTYTTDLTELGYTGSVETESGRYKISQMAACGASLKRCVVITAEAQRPQPEGDLTLNSKGAKGSWD